MGLCEASEREIRSLVVKKLSHLLSLRSLEARVSMTTSHDPAQRSKLEIYLPHFQLPEDLVKSVMCCMEASLSRGVTTSFQPLTPALDPSSSIRDGLNLVS